MTLSEKKTNILVLGSGPAGYTAALYAARDLLEPVLITGPSVGGQMATSHAIENFPGFDTAIDGPGLMERMRRQAEAAGADVVSDEIVSADLTRRPFTLVGAAGATYRCDALVIATGGSKRWLGLASEQKYIGSGVSSCATCDGIFFTDLPVAVVGGGDTAVDEALYLADIVSKVTLLHRGDALRAEPVLQKRLRENGKIDVMGNSTVTEITGSDEFPPGLRSVTTRNLRTGEVTVVQAQGLFVAIGYEPATAAAGGQLKLNSSGGIWTEPGSSRTSIEGVFAAGDVTAEGYGQAVTAAAMGCVAALEARKFLAGAGDDKSPAAMTAGSTQDQPRTDTENEAK